MRIALLLLSAALAAAQTGEVRGRVTDPLGASIQGAEVRLIPPAPQGLQRRARSEKDGSFKLADLEPGMYLLRISRPGFGNESIEVEILGGQVEDVGPIELKVAVSGCGGIMVWALPPGTALVSGTTFDTSGGTLPASVRLLPKDSRTPVQATRSCGGFFTLNVPAGTYMVRIHNPGFRTAIIQELVLAGGEPRDLGKIVLNLSGCDAPGVICDSVGPPERGVTRDAAVLRPGCGVDLNREDPRCESESTRSDVRLAVESDGAVYLGPSNGALFSECGTDRFASERIRIDGFERGTEWCVRTHLGRQSHVFIASDSVERNASDVVLSYVTRR